MHLPKFRFTTLAALFLAARFLQACGGSDRSHVPDGSSSSFTPAPRVTARSAGDDVATGACDLGMSRDCRVWLPTSGDVKNCFVGTQVCADGTWSGCLDDQDAAELLSG